jgi:hypothetical protein
VRVAQLIPQEAIRADMIDPRERQTDRETDRKKEREAERQRGREAKRL